MILLLNLGLCVLWIGSEINVKAMSDDEQIMIERNDKYNMDY